MMRLDQLRSEGGYDGRLWDENEHERRVIMFEWVVGTTLNPLLC